MNTSAAALLALRAFRSSTSPIKSNNNSWSVRTLASTTKQSKPTSSASGGSKAISSGGGSASPEARNYDPPSNVFKQESALGPEGTSKEGGYKNPEYFAYHNMSYTDMELVMAKFRVPQPSCKK